MEFARQLFQQAIQLDPDYVLAHAGLADCYSYMYLYSGRKEEDRRQAEAASRRAVELDPNSAQAQTSHGLALSAFARNDEAEAAFEAALRLDPNLFEANYFFARHCFAAGQQEKALRLYEEAMRVRPEDYQAPLLMAQIYDDLGRGEEGAAARRRGVENAEEHLRAQPGRRARRLYGRERTGRARRARAQPAVGGPRSRHAAQRRHAALQPGLHLRDARPYRRGPRLPGEGRPSSA